MQYDNSVSKRQLLDKDEVSQAIVKPENFGKKQMLCIWWDFFEILKCKETVNSELYCAQLEMIKEKLLKIRPALVNINRRGVLF